MTGAMVANTNNATERSLMSSKVAARKIRRCHRISRLPARPNRRCKAATWIMRTSMSDQDSFLSVDSYSRSQAPEHMLNTAITQAKIGESFEEYLEIFRQILCR